MEGGGFNIGGDIKQHHGRSFEVASSHGNRNNQSTREKQYNCNKVFLQSDTKDKEMFG